MDGPAEREDVGRWAAATTVPTTGHDPGAELRRRRSRRAVWLVGLLVVVAVLASTRHSAAGSMDHPASVPAWRQVLGASTPFAGLALAAVGLRRLRRAGRVAPAGPPPLLALTRQQRMRLLRQVRGQAPVEPARLPLLRDLAARMQKQYGLLCGPVALLVGGVALVLAGEALDRLDRWLVVALVSCLLHPFSVLAARRDARRAGALLARHPDPGAC